MQKKIITLFWLIYDIFSIYIISCNTTLQNSQIVVIPGENVQLRHNFIDFYLGKDFATIIIAVLSISGCVILNKFFRKEKNTFMYHMSVFIIMLLINFIIFRLKVDIIY